MNGRIRNYLDENKDMIREEMEWAVRESFSISESPGAEEKISVVLTDAFELKSFSHPSSYSYSTDVVYVLYSFESEIYIVDYNDVNNFLNEKQSEAFHEMLLANAEDILDLENDELMELSKKEKLFEVIYCIDSESRVLEMFEQFDEGLYNEYIADIYNHVDTSYIMERAMERMLDNLNETGY